MISTNRPGPLSLLPDRGSPTLIRLVGPCRTAHIKGRWGDEGSDYEVRREPPHPPTVTQNQSKDRAASDGMCPTTAVDPLQGHHQTTVSPPAPLDFTATALDVFYTAAPASTRYDASTKKTRSLPGSTGHTEVPILRS